MNRFDRVLRVMVAAVVFVGLVEFGAALVWRLAVPETQRATVVALCGQGAFPVRYLPHERWHHRINPAHPDYAGRVNSHGTLGPEFAAKKPRGEFRILCIGDSTMEGVGVAADSSLPARLRALLPAATVINAGVGLHNSQFTRDYLSERLLDFEPDLVVIRSSYNDWLPFCVPGMGENYSHAFPAEYWRAEPSSYWRSVRWSPALKLVGAVLFRAEVMEPCQDFSVPVSMAMRQMVDFSANADRFAVYGGHVRAMVRACHGIGAEVLLLDLPVSPSENHYGPGRSFGSGIKGLMIELGDELAQVAVQEGVALISTGPPQAGDFRDWCHPTASGNERAAQAVALAMPDIGRKSR